MQLLVGAAVAFVIGYAAIAWLLRFVQKHSLAWFAGYRIILGLLVMGLLATGTIPATWQICRGGAASVICLL